MAHQVETMAYNRAEVPWHGLGQPVDANMTVDEMLVAAGLDWEVNMQPMFAQAKDGTMIKMLGKRALMRSSDNKILTNASEFWKPMQNKEVLEFFREYTESGGASLETAGSLRGGKVIWALARINKGFIVKGSRSDEVKGYVLLCTRHEVGTRHKLLTTATRVVCANTLAMAERDMCAFSQNHMTVFDTAKAKESIGLARDQIAQMEIDIGKLAVKPISEFDKLKILCSVFDPEVENSEYLTYILDHPEAKSKDMRKIYESIDNAPGADPKTAWGVLNGVTHFFDHVAGHDSSARLYNAWFGDRASKKLEVMEKLLDYAS